MIIATYGQNTSVSSALASKSDPKGKGKARAKDPDSDSDIEVLDGPPASAGAAALPLPHGWAYVGSHNFTPSAWGTLSGSAFSPTLNVCRTRSPCTWALMRG